MASFRGTRVLAARVHAALGDMEAAIEWLPKAEEEGSELFTFADWGGLRTDPAWDGFLDHPRFRALSKTVGVDPWHFQVFAFDVIEERPVRDVDARVGIPAGQVYLIKHRVASRPRREMKQKQLERQSAGAS